MSDGEGCTCMAYGEHECCCDVDWTEQRVYDLQDEVASLRKALNDDHKWHSVEDTYPEIDSPVLYYFEVTGIAVGRYHGQGAFGGSRGHLHDEVTHWMPLPQAPSIERKNNE